MSRRHPAYLILTSALLAAAMPSAGSTQAAPGAPAQSEEPRVIEVTVGERVRLSVRTADGVHGIEIKKFKVKKEIPRGTEPVIVDFTATETGRFPILCSEYCGNGHDDMKGTLVVTAQEPQAP